MSLLNRHTKTVTIQRQSKSQTSGMGVTTSYSTGNRPSGAPTSLSCRVMQPSAKERFEFNQQDQQTDIVLIFTTDPEVDTRDRCVLGSEEFYVLATRNPQRMDKFWTVACSLSSRNVK